MFDGNSCGVLSAIHEQSEDINRGVERGEEEQGAGDQGMMFGYATNETENYMPLALDLSHRLLQELADLRRYGKDIPYLRPDAKAQVTIEYSDDNVPQRIDSIVVSTQHDDFSDNDEEMLAKIKSDIVGILIPRVKAKLSADLQALFTDKITTNFWHKTIEPAIDYSLPNISIVKHKSNNNGCGSSKNARIHYYISPF